MVRGVRIKDHWREQRLFERRTVIAGALIFALILALVSRLAVLQVSRHEYYSELSQGNRVRIEPIPAARGLILDRHGEVLADNQPAYQLELVREETPDVEASLQKLVSIGLLQAENLDEVRKTIRSRRSFDSVPIRLHLSDEDIARFAVRRFEFPGLDIRTRLARSYPRGEVGVHALGYVAAISERDLQRIDRAAYSGTSLIGKLGVESTYETPLHGTNGFRQILVNAQGRSVEKYSSLAPDLKVQAPIAGQDLVLSMDMKVQQAAEDALTGHRGAVVAIDPNTGDVIALASRPGFDPNMFGRGLTHAEYDTLQNDIDRPLFNRALRGTYPPGSTVKPVIALAGLAYHVLDPENHRFCNGIFRLPGSSHQYREGRGGRHGPVDLEDAIAKSCDTYFYALADVLGVDHIATFLEPFGFGKLTGIDITGEKPGLLPSREWKKRTFTKPGDQVWFPGETVIFGIGQGYLLVTPLQLAHYVAVIAARGRSFKPRLVTGFRDPITGKVRQVAPLQTDEVKSNSTDQWDRIFAGMEGTMTRGTGHSANSGASYVIAGKTGTAQVFSVAQNEKYNEKTVQDRLRDHAWFIAFAPADAPKIAVAVLVENGGFGASAAAPIARKVMDAYLLDGPPPDKNAKPGAAGKPGADKPAVPAKPGPAARPPAPATPAQDATPNLEQTRAPGHDAAKTATRFTASVAPHEYMNGIRTAREAE